MSKGRFVILDKRIIGPDGPQVRNYDAYYPKRDAAEAEVLRSQSPGENNFSIKELPKKSKGRPAWM